MKILLEKSKYHKFALYFDYTPSKVEFCKDLKDSFGWDKFSFDVHGELKRWVFSDSIFIQILAEKFPEIQIDEEVHNTAISEKKWIKEEKSKNERIDVIRTKETTDFEVKGLKGEMYAYQKVGVEFLEASGGRAIIADSMGIGKSLQALAYIKYKGFKRSLIVCPASVKFSWENEVKKWTNMSSVIIDSKTDLALIDSSVNIWIINYDILKKHYPQLSKIKFYNTTGDECQYCKNPKSLRTKAFRALAADIPSVVLLSGTPLLSRPSELYSLLNIIDPTRWTNWYEYATKYCNLRQTRWGMDSSGVSNAEELHSLIKRYFIRREKKDVLVELPPKVFVDIPVQLDPKTKKEYDSAATDLANYLRDYAGKKNPEIERSMSAEKLTQLNILRKLSAMGKMKAALELIESIVDSGEKVLVFSSFVEPLMLLQSKIKSQSVMITGKTPVGERGEIVDKFQNDNNVKVFLGGTKSAGVGITLTAASSVIFLDYSFNPADLLQAQDRAHRIGTKAKSVNVYFLHAKGTIDEDLKEMIHVKQEIFDQIIDGKFEKKKSTDIMKITTDRILKEY